MNNKLNYPTTVARTSRTGSGGERSTPASSRLIVGIGDLHGHYPALERLLKSLQSSYFIFGPNGQDRLRPDVTLVFTGDYIDRGDDALSIIDRGRLECYLEEMKRWITAPSRDVGGTRQKWARLAKFVWGRSYSTPAPISKSAVDSLCQAVGVDFIVTGHTLHPSVDGIKVYGGKIFDIDVAMTPACGGRMPQALVFRDDAVVGFRADGREHVFQRFRKVD